MYFSIGYWLLLKQFNYYILIHHVIYLSLWKSTRNQTMEKCELYKSKIKPQMTKRQSPDCCEPSDRHFLKIVYSEQTNNKMTPTGQEKKQYDLSLNQMLIKCCSVLYSWGLVLEKTFFFNCLKCCRTQLHANNFTLFS